MDAIRNSRGGQELEGALKDIKLTELRQAALGLGLKVGACDLQWNSLVAQLNGTFLRLEDAQVDTSGFFSIYQMLEYMRSELNTLKNATYLALADILEEKDHVEFLKKQKQLHAKERKKKKKNVEQKNADAESDGHDTVN
jgi:hypothetical protein